MAPKRKPTPSVASSNPASPRTPVAHKQKKLNPPRLCVQTAAVPFTGRLTRGRARKKIQAETTAETDDLDDSDFQATTETETQDEEDEEVQIPKSKSVSLNARKKSIEESFELLTLKNKNSIQSLTTDIKKISIDSQSSQSSRDGSTASRNSRTNNHKKTVTYVLPRVAESDEEVQEASPTTKTPYRQGFKTPVRLVPSPGPSKRDIAELDKISLIEDTMADNFECFTRNVLFRDFELTTRESLVAAHSEVCMKMQELRRLTDMSLIGLSSDFLECELADVLQENGNPESLLDLINIYADKENKVTGNTNNNGTATAISSTVDMDRNSAADAPAKASFTSSKASKDSRMRLQRSDADDEGSITSGSESPDMFRTPKKQFLGTLPPLPPKTLKSAMKSNKTAFVFPSSRNMSSGSSGAENPATNNVFVFGSEATQTGVKVPRPVRPGEIAFSQSGSPIVSARDAILPSTPIQPAGKTVRIQVDNGEGRAIEVDIVYRGNPQEESDAKLFRAFMTDVRGVVTARSTARGKRVLPPHVPPKKPMAQKPGPSGVGAGAGPGLPKKPQWL